MSDIDPNAGDKLLNESVAFMNRQFDSLKGARQALEGLKAMGEDVSQLEASLAEAEKLRAQLTKTLKVLPKK